MTNRAHRLVAAGALAVAVAAPLALALTSGEATGVQAQCRAHFGNIEDNICLDGPDTGNSFTIGSPGVGVYGPSSGNRPRGGIGVTTGPLLPGQSWNVPLG